MTFIIIFASGIFGSFVTNGWVGSALRYKALKDPFTAELARADFAQELLWGTLLIGGAIAVSHFVLFKDKQLTYHYRSTCMLSCFITLICSWVSNWDQISILWGWTLIIPVFSSLVVLFSVLIFNDIFLNVFFKIPIQPYQHDVDDE